MRIVWFLGVSEGEKIPGLYERSNELRVAQRLHARILRVDGMLNRSLPVGVLIHHLDENEFQVCHSLSQTRREIAGESAVTNLRLEQSFSIHSPFSALMNSSINKRGIRYSNLKYYVKSIRKPPI